MKNLCLRTLLENNLDKGGVAKQKSGNTIRAIRSMILIFQFNKVMRSLL
jgi:hypothetical protein